MPGFIGKHEDLRLADARGDRHLFDDIHQALPLEVAVVGVHRYAAQRARNDGAAGTQLRAAVPGCDQDGPEHDGRDPEDDFGFLAPDAPRIAAKAEQHDEVDDGHDQQDAGNERGHQPEGVFALRFLPFEELRRHGSSCLAYSFNRRQQTSAKPDNRPCTGARPAAKTAPNATRLTVAAGPRQRPGTEPA